MWPDLMPLDVTSGVCSSELTSSCGLDMDFLVESFDLESCFCLDEILVLIVSDALREAAGGDRHLNFLKNL